jgi:hypothetical protein
MFPACKVDGAGQFRFPLGSRHHSWTGKHRTIIGYAFTSDGEAVYIIGDDRMALDSKRAWKANEEYTQF